MFQNYMIETPPVFTVCLACVFSTEIKTGTSITVIPLFMTNTRGKNKTQCAQDKCAKCPPGEN